MSMEQAFKTFIDESQELLQEMEDSLIGIEQLDDRDEAVSSIFRAAHTIKGSAGLFGLEAIVEFTHVVENVLDRVRSRELQLSDDLVGLLLSCKDYIGHQIDSINDGEVILTEQDKSQESALLSQLYQYTEAPDQSDNSTATAQELTSGNAGDTGETAENHNWHISVHFGEDCLRNGLDPLSFLRFLQTLGTIEHIETVCEEILPECELMDPESCYLAFEINFSSPATKQEIEDVFEFVREDCQLHIIPPQARITEFIDVINNLSMEDLKIGEILVRCGTLTELELERILSIQHTADTETQTRRPLGELIVERQAAAPEVVEAALQKQEQLKKQHSQTVRVNAEKLDTLIDLIGELVIASASIESEIRETGIGRLVEASLPMVRLVEEVRDSTLNLRMVQIGDTFNRFHRVVRDVSKDLGKSIELQISGGDTELDKTVIEKITDPLTHLVRNAIDHGIEATELRVQAGKPETGHLRLNAYHESGSIVIEVADDGGGLNRDRLMAKAVEKGLVSADAEMSDQDVYQLIFEAGFSTANAVSNISGRGVGMDVVRRNIEALRGTIEIDSVPSSGTTIRIRLPLTLAIIDGFLVEVGKNAYVIPLEMVVECIELREEDRVAIEKRGYINLRGEVLPYARLRELFNLPGEPAKRESIVVVQYGTIRAGFAVDSLQGEFQTVIKPLSKLFESLSGIGGSTILGSGDVALILDVPSLVQRIEQQEKHNPMYAKAASISIQ